MAQDYELRVHRDWIGLLQPVGLVVSPPALVTAGAFPDKNVAREQHALLALMMSEDGSTKPVDFATFATTILGWKANKLIEASQLPESLSLILPEFGETLRPTYAVPAPPEPGSGNERNGEWLLLVEELPDGTSFDEPPPEEGRRWHASPQVRLERLLYETGVGIGILSNRRSLRLVFKPRGESSGHVTWPLHRLVTAMDRTMLSALVMLLGNQRLFVLHREQRLPTLLKESRKYQNVVSNKLAGQVLEALNELLRGFQAADETTHGVLLGQAVREDPEHVYGGLLAVLLRLVFVLYAEERGLLSASPVYVRNYSLTGLFEKLRSDAGRFPDTMDQRYGAWSRLLVLFRMVHDGAQRGELQLPPRFGHLFDPDAWSFLEGRTYRVSRVMGAPVPVPKVADGVLYRVLEKLLLLDGERLSYRALDVEQIGSVYENMMGFRLERATETSIGIGKQHVVIGLETLLQKKGAEREKLLKEQADVEVSGKAAEALKSAASVDDLVAALARRISVLTSRPVPLGGLFLQPTDERRRSGSHYTPRELTEPIVRTTLRPILEDLGASPKPQQILALHICDPAMGSGAFLVETCRQLAEALDKSYDVHGRPPDVRPDEDTLLYARRQVAQHCLYGVDKNPFAVDLGKLSLWLATLARDHTFTFLDHSIRHGDSLVGLTGEQIASFHWDSGRGAYIKGFIEGAINEALTLREKIPELATSDDVGEKRRLLRDADDALATVRLLGDAVVACFFSSDKNRERERERDACAQRVLNWLKGESREADIQGLVDDLHEGERPVPCFHWHVEFPEVFLAGARGFDAIVGNPPFAGKNNIINGNRPGYLPWLQMVHEGAHGNADLAAHFYRRAFTLLRDGGTFGLIATNTIAQGDTRGTGLRWIRHHGGHIYAARRRVKWPGKAAVTVSVVHVSKGMERSPRLLDGRQVERITAFLFHRGSDDDPLVLRENADTSFIGSYVLGMGFTFDDSKEDATPIAVMRKLIKRNPRNEERIFPYLGGDEVNERPTHAHHRYVINFAEMSEEEARGGWPELMTIIEQKVKPERMKLGDNPDGRRRKAHWWQWGRYTPALFQTIAKRKLERVLVIGRVSQCHAPAFLPTGQVYSEQLVVIADTSFSRYAVLQSRPHEYWFRAFGSTHEERPRYTPSDVFETFPFPTTSEAVEAVGREYYDYRANLMVDTKQGLTDTYNCFNDPEETSPEILKLRELHAALDRAVLDAYEWTDIQPTCEFILDHEDDDEDESARRRKKPWRYRWSDEIRNEVLARLLELNAKRAKAQLPEPIISANEQPATSVRKKRGSRKNPGRSHTLPGFEGDE